MRIMKARDVADMTSISIPHIRRMARDGNFPLPIKISDCRSGWLEADVQEWISQCVRRHQKAIK